MGIKPKLTALNKKSQMVGKRYRCVTFSCKALSRNLKPPIVSRKFWFNNDVNHNVADLFFLRGK